MPDTLEEIRNRNSILFIETERGDYREINRRDLYRDIHWLAKRLRELEQRTAPAPIAGHDPSICECSVCRPDLPGNRPEDREELEEELEGIGE